MSSSSFWRAIRRVAPMALVATLGACALKDLTSAPIWDVRMNIPSKSTTLSVGTMLPSGVSIAPDSASFRVTVAPVTITQTLAQACPACVPLNGLSAPKPAFTFTQTSTAALPSDVATAALASGTITIAISNGYAFDPINVAGAATPGTLVITATDANNRQLAKDSVNGATTSLPANGRLNRTLTLAAGALKGPITITAVVNSPAGSNITANTAQVLTVTGTPTNIAISTASVNVTNKPISSSATNLDFSDLGSAISDRVTAATIFLAINNPFTGVTGNLSVRFQGSGVDFTKALTLASGASTPRLALTQAEVKSLLGKQITLGISGAVSAAAPVTVAPKDAVTVGTRIEVTMTTESK